MKNLQRVIAFIVLVFGLFGSATAISKDRVNMVWLPSTHALPFFVALEEGIFAEYGIEPVHSLLQNPNHIIDALVSGRADVGPAASAAGITVLAESRFPGTFRVFGLQGSNTEKDMINDRLIVVPNSGIGSFADLKGKRLATTPGIQWRTISRTIIRANGLDPDRDVQIVEMAIPLQAQSVASRNVDAALTLEPAGSIADALGNVETPLINPTAVFIADPFYAGASLVTTRFLEQRPDVAKRVILALDRAVELISEDFDRYRPYLVKHTAVTDETVSLVAPMYYRNSVQIDEADIAAYQAFADIFHADGVMAEKLDVSTLLLRATDID